MNKKTLLKLYTSFVTFCLIVLLVAPSSSRAPIKIAEAAGPVFDVLGYAWSYHPHEQENDSLPNVSATTPVQTGTQGFGWISMSGANQSSGGGSYKVTLDPTTGKFSGYAWSENGGWVNFAPTGPFPAAAGTTAQSAFVDPTCLADKTRTCDVKGWIRFTGAVTGNSSWDGWINMEIFNDATAADVYSFPNSAPAKGVKLLPESGGFRNMAGYAWGDDLAGIIGFANAKVQLNDVCPDTKFATGDPKKDASLDPKTVGTQTTMPAGYSVQTINGVVMCGIFGCTDKTAVNYVKGATIDDGSCVPFSPLCPDGSEAPNGDPKQCPEDPVCTPKSDDYNPVFKDCRECNQNTKDYDPKTGLCESVVIDPTCPDGSAIPPGGCPSSTNVCTTASPTYNPVFKDCRECHPGVAGYNATTGLCTVTVQCEATSPDYNPITKDCRTCHPGVAGYNDKTGRCSVPGKHKVIDVIET